MKNLLKFAFALTAVLALAVSQAQAQFSLTGTGYTQDFDSMGSTGTTAPTGWNVGTNATQQTATGDTNGVMNGSISANTIVVNNGLSVNAGANYNWGTNGVNTTADRALGSLASASKTRETEFRFTNNTGLTITDLTISYAGEQYRLGKTGVDVTSGLGDRLQLGYSTDGSTFTVAGTAFDFVSPTTSGTIGQLDGNATANRTTGLGGTLSGINIGDGATFYLRWMDADSGGNDNGLAIDNVSLTAVLVPEPSTVLLVGMGLLGLVAVRRRRS